MPERKLHSLLIVTGAILLTLALLPATRWLLRLQTRSLVLSSFLTDNREGRERRVAEANPRDYQIQVARAIAAPLQRELSSQVKIQRLNALTERFPNEPSLYAHLLRYYAAGTVGMHREEQNELSAEPVPRADKPKHSLSADLAAFDAAAAQGERLDPNNAYFPFIRAAGLYEAGRDADAIAAIHRAGQKTRFEDYASAEFQAKDRFYAQAHGRQGGIERVSLAAAILFPHFAIMRGTARMSTVSAIHAELAGNADLGVQIRHDTMRVGDLMRVQGRSLIANLVGIAIAAIPQGRPGGVPAVKSDATTDAQREQLLQAKREKYYAYLRSIGHDNEARFAKAELEAGIRARQVSAKITDNMTEQGPFGIRSLVKTGLWWVADLLTLTNALGLLILGGMALLAAKARPITNVKAWRVALGVAAAALFGLLAANVNHLATDLYAGPIQLMNLSGNSVQDTPYGAEFLVHALGIAFSLGFPLLLIGTVGIVSLKSRTAFIPNLGRWLRVLAIPIACGLLLLYSLLLLGTAQQEERMRVGLDKMLTHEAAYNASQVGQTWPGSVR